MNLKLLLPYRVFLERDNVTRIVTETASGSFGILPRRLDGVAALVPGILLFETATDGVAYVAIDEGILIKTGAQVLVSVRNAIAGTDLGQLRAAVEQTFLNLDDAERNARLVLAKLESSFIYRFRGLRGE